MPQRPQVSTGVATPFDKRDLNDDAQRWSWWILGKRESHGAWDCKLLEPVDYGTTR